MEMSVPTLYALVRPIRKRRREEERRQKEEKRLRKGDEAAGARGVEQLLAAAEQKDAHGE
jgi:hypothetical protein